MAVTEDLNLDVARSFDIALKVHAGMSEVCHAHAGDGIVVFFEFAGVSADAHANSAASGCALQNDRVSAAFGFGECGLFTVEQARSRQQRRAFPKRDFTRGMLQSKRPHLRRRRTEKHETGVFARLREFRVLAEKPVSGMNRFRFMLPCRVEYCRLIQVAFRCRGWAEKRRRIRPGNMKRVTIRFGEHGDWRDAELSQGSNDPARDHAAIGD